MKIAWMPLYKEEPSDKQKLQKEFYGKCKNYIIANWLMEYRLDPNGKSEEGKWGRVVSHKDMARKVTSGRTKETLLFWGLTLKEISDLHGENYV